MRSDPERSARRGRVLTGEPPEKDAFIAVLREQVPCLTKLGAELHVWREHLWLFEAGEELLDTLGVADGLVGDDQQEVKVYVVEPEVSRGAEPVIIEVPIELSEGTPAESPTIAERAIEHVPDPIVVL